MILDILAVAIFFVCVIIAYKTGFLKALLGIASSLVTFILVFVFYGPAFEIVNSSNVHSIVFEKVKELLGGNAVGDITLPIPPFLQDQIMPDINDAAQNAHNVLVENLTNLIIGALCIIGLFILIKILLKLFVPLLDKLFRLPLLNEVNKLAGLLIGIVNGIFLIFLSCILVMFLTGTQISLWISDQLVQSSLFIHFYNNNFILKLFVG